MAAADAGQAAELARRRIDVAGHELGGEAQAAHRLQHQHREVAAGAAPMGQRFRRRLRRSVQPRGVAEVAVDRLGHLRQQHLQAGAAFPAHEGAGPAFDQAARVGMRPLHGPRQVGHVLGAVGEGRAAQVRFQLAVHAGEGLDRRVLQRHAALEAKLGGAAREPGDAHAVAEHVVRLAKVAGIGRDRHRRRNDPLVVAFEGPEHHPVFAKPYRLAVTVSRQVTDR